MNFGHAPLTNWGLDLLDIHDGWTMLDIGSWAQFTSENNPNAKLNAFRGYYLADTPAESAVRRAPATQDKRFHTLFSNAGVANVSDASVPDALNILYDADIPTPTATGISPILQTIEADGTSRYFDIQGRMLNGKPDKGLYIEKGKKVFVK